MNEVASVQTVAVPGFWLMMLKSIGMLCIVIALLVGVLFIVRQLTEKRGSKLNKNLIGLLASFHVAPKEKVMLLDVMDRKILIGVTQQSINCLAIFDEADGLKPSDEKTGSGFQGMLETVSQRQLAESEDETSEEKK